MAAEDLGCFGAPLLAPPPKSRPQAPPSRTSLGLTTHGDEYVPAQPQRSLLFDDAEPIRLEESLSRAVRMEALHQRAQPPRRSDIGEMKCQAAVLRGVGQDWEVCEIELDSPHCGESWSGWRSPESATPTSIQRKELVKSSERTSAVSDGERGQPSAAVSDGNETNDSAAV